MGHRERNVVAVSVILMLTVLPLFGSDFFVDFVMTRTLMLGMAAATVVFLSAYGGMVSLAQWLLFGVAGFAALASFATFASIASGFAGLTSGLGSFFKMRCFTFVSAGFGSGFSGAGSVELRACPTASVTNCLTLCPVCATASWSCFP